MNAQLIEKEVALPGVSVLIGVSQWAAAEDWICPADSYVVCQRRSSGHSALRVDAGPVAMREVYSHVHSLGFMPSTGRIRIYPLDRPFRTLNCFFDRTYFEAATQIDAEEWREHAGAFMTVCNPFIQSIMDRIHVELVQPGFGSEQVIEAAGAMIAVEMARLGRQRSGRTPLEGRGAGGLAPWQMRRIRERLDASEACGYPRIQELAELCGISRGHLMRMYKLSTGQPLHQHIAEERLGAAGRMLAADRASIKQIAAALGFCNTAHFTTAFRRMAGMTPSDFRRQARTRGAGAAPDAPPDLRRSAAGRRGDLH